MGHDESVGIATIIIIGTVVFVQITIALNIALRAVNKKTDKIMAKMDSMQSVIMMSIQRREVTDKVIEEIKEVVTKDGEAKV